MSSKLTLVNNKLRVETCGGALVLSSADEDCCCGKCGCTNPDSPNYDPDAERDDGSCATCCNQGRCVINDNSPCKGPNCNPVGTGCCDSGCLPCNGTGSDCSKTFDSSYTPKKFCSGTESFTYYDCYSCPQSIKARDTDQPTPAFLELQEILESKFGGPYASPEDRRRITLLPEKISTPYDVIGPGTTLSSFFAVFGVHATPQCVCSFRAYVMDVMGCKWCLKNLLLIADWLGQEARRRKIPYTRFAGFCAVLSAVAVSSLLQLVQRKFTVHG